MDLFNGVSTHFLSECPGAMGIAWVDAWVDLSPAGRGFNDVGAVCVPNLYAMNSFPLQVLSRLLVILMPNVEVIAWYSSKEVIQVNFQHRLTKRKNQQKDYISDWYNEVEEGCTVISWLLLKLTCSLKTRIFSRKTSPRHGGNQWHRHLAWWLLVEDQKINSLFVCLFVCLFSFYTVLKYILVPCCICSIEGRRVKACEFYRFQSMEHGVCWGKYLILLFWHVADCILEQASSQLASPFTSYFVFRTLMASFHCA